MNRSRRKYTNQQLEEAVICSSNYTEVIKALGLQPAGGNHKHIKYLIEEHNLDTSHFNDSKQLKALARSRRKLKDEQIFCEHSHVKGVRPYALKIIFPYECNLCKNTGYYNNQELTLQIDHINGVHDDNRKENLRWLCPNCHSQTSTFCRKIRT